MDWVQIYYAVLLGLRTTACVVMDGRARSEIHYHWKDAFVGLVMSAPIIGRIYGWW